MKRQGIRIASPVLVLAALGIVLWVNAGDLNPPEGPVAPTGRFGPRIEVNDINTPGDATSSFRITQTGSYYLADNITGEAGKNGIRIESSGVTLDLNGFAMTGIAGSLHGIENLGTTPKVRDITVKNGTVRNWGGEGVHLAQMKSGRLMDLHVSGNGSDGIHLGESWVVVRCTAMENGDWGISAAGGSSVSNCTAANNAGDGFQMSGSISLLNCASYQNTGNGFSGMYGGSLTSCATWLNGGDGMHLEGLCTVTACTVLQNDGDGIEIWRTYGGSTIESCTVNENGSKGIIAGEGSSVTNCTANKNGVDGINTQDGCTVAGCTSYGNGGFGISASNSLVRGNTMMNNTGGNCNTPGSTVIENHGCP